MQGVIVARNRRPLGRARTWPAPAANASTNTFHTHTPHDRCASCGTTSTPMWRKGMQRGELVALCNACGIRVKRGKCCPYCQVTYDGEAPADDHDDPWSQCAGCARWLHAACYQHAKPAGAPAGAARCADCLRGGAAPAPPAKKARRSSQATPAAASGASSLPHVPKGARSSSGTTKRRRSSAALPREDGAARRGCGALSAAALRAGSRGTEHNLLAPSTPQPLRPTASWEDLLPVDRARLLMRAVNQPRPSVVKQPAAADCAATGGPAQQLCGVQVAA